MSKEISKNLMCLIMRNGVQIWFEENQSKQVSQLLTELKEHKFIKFKEQIFNTADVTGIFNAETMETHNKVKRGQWQDKYGGWHDKFEKVDEEELRVQHILNN